MLVTLAEAKSYLRQDSNFEDTLITTLIGTAERICCDVARLSSSEFEAITALTVENTSPITVRSESVSVAEALGWQSVLKGAVLYVLGYMYEHREEGDLKEVVMTLRHVLHAIREGVF